MGASTHLRWVAVVAAASLAAAVPAGAQQPASPDAAPSGSSAPHPDPAPVKTKPRVAVRAAPRPVAAATTTAAPPVPAATNARPRTGTPAPRPTTRRPTSHHRKTVQRRKRPAHVVLPRLPHLTPAQLSAPARTADSDRARKLALGALSLLILALASATLLAFTARVERRRVVR
jgi:hypothetical protein